MEVELLTRAAFASSEMEERDTSDGRHRDPVVAPKGEAAWAVVGDTDR